MTNKKQDLYAKLLAGFLAVLVFLACISVGALITYTYDLSPGVNFVVGMLFGWPGALIAMTVYYAVYSKRRYKF